MKRYILVALMLCVLVGVACADDWLDGWNFRKIHDITGNTTWPTQTNYQVEIIVNTGNGESSGDTVYLSGRSQADLDDLRVTSYTPGSEPTLYDYWIESTSNPYTVWVEIPTLTNGTNQIAVYFGNTTATAYSNGTNTFPVFDTFLGISLNTDIWARWLSSGTTTVSDGKVRVTGGSDVWEAIGTKYQRTYPYAARMYTQYSAEGANIFTGVDERSDGGGGVSLAHWINGGTKGFYTRKAGTDQYSSRTSDLTTATIIEVRQVDNTAIYFYENDVLTQTHTTQVPDVNMGLAIAVNGNTRYVDCFWGLYRNYIVPEPVHSTGWAETSCVVSDFHGIPTSGDAPLFVSFFDDSISRGEVTVDKWSWAFYDDASTSTLQNPTHYYDSVGSFTVGLSASNYSVNAVDSETKTYYINVTLNTDIPVADFTVTETCGSTSDTFYFIDFSTGGGLYAWNWSFGDGGYSELRNPTHQYASNGTYSVNLSVWGTYGFDSLLRENLITIPCGAPTPTPTPTVTPTGTPPVQPAIPEGRIPPLAFVVLSLITCGCVVYTFVDNENRNYLHIGTAAVAMLLSFLLAVFLITGGITVDFVVELEQVTVNESVLSTYDVQHIAITDIGFAYFFVFFGVVMLIITMLAVIEVIKQPQRRLDE